MPPWITHLFSYFRTHPIPKDFVGQIEVNVFKGGVTNVNVRQSFKEENAK